MAFGLGMGIAAALSMGVVPFLVGDALKVAIAFGVMPGAWKLLGMNKARD
jgi:biotin transport system substrate-specific component